MGRWSSSTREGLLTVRTAAELHEVLAKDLTEHSRVVVDLGGLRGGAVRDASPVGFPGPVQRQVAARRGNPVARCGRLGLRKISVAERVPR
ncbi:MAG: hypothetical protein ACRDRA_16100 [Pseudonocardiaceae bacterium]